MSRENQEPEILPSHRYNEKHPKISPIFANVCLLAGPEHWKIKNWNPVFGNINRYKLEKWIGSGSYSDVFIGLQDNTKKCAIKVLKPVNLDRVRRELKILTIMQYTPNALQLMDILIDSRNGIPSFVTEYIPSVSWRTLVTKLPLDGIRTYIYKLIQVLVATHSKGIMHRDVKPANILCKNPDDEVVLADWGLAEFYHPLHKYSTHVGTKFYKAPELVLGYGFYNYAVDMWAVGCTLLEMLSRKIHVFSSDDPERMIFVIGSILGGDKIIKMADKYQIELMPNVRAELSRLPGTGIRRLINRHNMDEQAIDLVEKLLVIDHRERMTSVDALTHPFFNPITFAYSAISDGDSILP